MRRPWVVPILAGLLLMGCSSAFQGIKMRAQSPSLEEAYRKLSLAVSTDGYRFALVDPAAFSFETEWRDATLKERTDPERALPLDAVQARVTLRLDRRGMLYDAFLTPSLRYKNPDGSWRETVAAVRHPLREKWEKALKSLLQAEAKEED